MAGASDQPAEQEDDSECGVSRRGLFPAGEIYERQARRIHEKGQGLQCILLWFTFGKRRQKVRFVRGCSAEVTVVHDPWHVACRPRTTYMHAHAHTHTHTRTHTHTHTHTHTPHQRTSSVSANTLCTSDTALSVSHPWHWHNTLHTHVATCRREFREQLQAQIKEDQKKCKPSTSTDEYEEALQKDKAAKEQDARELIEKACFLKKFKETNKTASTCNGVITNDRYCG